MRKLLHVAQALLALFVGGCVNREAQKQAKRTEELISDPTILVTVAPATSTDLAETLEAVAYGLKHRIGSRADYLLRIGRAVRLVCGPRPAEGPRRA